MSDLVYKEPEFLSPRDEAKVAGLSKTAWEPELVPTFEPPYSPELTNARKLRLASAAISKSERYGEERVPLRAILEFDVALSNLRDLPNVQHVASKASPVSAFSLRYRSTWLVLGLACLFVGAAAGIALVGLLFTPMIGAAMIAFSLILLIVLFKVGTEGERRENTENGEENTLELLHTGPQARIHN